MPDTSLAVGKTHEFQITAGAAFAAAEIWQLRDGRAARKQFGAVASGALAEVKTDGIWVVPKTTGIVILDGMPVYWDHSLNEATYRTNGDRDFYLGTAKGDAASADTTLSVFANVAPAWDISLGYDPRRSQPMWTCEETSGLGVFPLPGGGVQLAFDAVAEAAQAAFYSERTFPNTANAILRLRLACYNIGDNAALDINFGLSNGSHATDFESVTEFVGFHLDGNSLVINAQSRDGTTTVAVATTGVSLVDDTYKEFWIDTRDSEDVKLYIDAARVLSNLTFKIDAASGNLRPILHLEKTSDDTVADFRASIFDVLLGEH